MSNSPKANTTTIGSSDGSNIPLSLQAHPLRIGILHLDLGIGGAEQLIVNIAKQLQSSGHKVHLFTTHHDVNHCFEETKPDGVLGQQIYVYGDFLPRNIFKRFTAFCATIRMIFLALCFLCFHYFSISNATPTSNSSRSNGYYDVVIVDGVSTPLPLLKAAGCRILFYCHFPDMLLCTQGRDYWLKAMYRRVLDTLEAQTTATADSIVVNSHFTAQVCRDTWSNMFLEASNHSSTAHSTNNSAHKKAIQVLYPVVDIPGIPAVPSSNNSNESNRHNRPHYASYDQYDTVFVSLNRYERKKKIEVALEAMAILIHEHENNSDTNDRHVNTERVLLVIAGGYDDRVAENREYLLELQQLCDQLKLSYIHDTNSNHWSDGHNVSRNVHVIFRTNISSAERQTLFLSSTALLYTPDREHFGIVPLEAMGLGLPVIAVASGGPLESVRHNRTGFLVTQQTGAAFARFMRHLLVSAEKEAVQEKKSNHKKEKKQETEGWQEYQDDDHDSYEQVQTIQNIERINEEEILWDRQTLSTTAIRHVKTRFSAEVMRQELNDLVYSLSRS